MIPTYYEFYNPVKIISGKKALDNIPYELEQMGVKRPLVVTDKGVVKAGLVKILKDAFKGSGMTIGAVYDDTPADSSLQAVKEIAALYRENNCDSLIALGGGSPIDTAKGVNIVITEEADDLMQFVGAERLTKKMKPLVVIPTTAGTGSEVTLVAVIADTERNVKMLFTSYHLLPNVAVLDPRMTLTAPAKITAATGMDALTHAMEAYYCIQKNPMSDAYALGAIQLIRDNLIRAVEKGKDDKARLAMANAATMAGAAFSNSMVGIVHGIGHAVGAVSHVPHGVAMSILLPFGLEYNLDKSEEHIGELLFAIASPEEYAATSKEQRANRTIDHVRDLQKKLFELSGLPMTLKDAGVEKNQLEAIAKTATGDGALTFNPVEVEYDDILRVLHEAYE